MRVRKTVLARLNKCYAIARLDYQGNPHFLVASEKSDPCCLFDQDGMLKDVLWTGPGGVMTMVQVPGTDGQLLSTAKFYSPDDSLDAELVIVTPEGNNRWDIRCLTPLPHVHRFDILTRNGVNWLIACTVKSGQDRPEGDWSYPGKVYAAVLPGRSRRQVSHKDNNSVKGLQQIDAAAPSAVETILTSRSAPAIEFYR